jgi:hypothetical protein
MADPVQEVQIEAAMQAALVVKTETLEAKAVVMSRRQENGVVHSLPPPAAALLSHISL